MRKYLARLKSDSALILLPTVGLLAADPLEHVLGIPALLTNAFVAVGFLIWMAFYAVRVWGQSARDKQALAAKHAAADAQLFGPGSSGSGSKQ